jgi:hypothetical protein
MKSPTTSTAQGKKGAPPRIRCRLRTIDDAKAELARLYREAKSGRRPIADASKLCNMLFILVRMIEGSDLERRLERLEGNANG